MVRLWTFTSLFLFIRARTLDAQMAPLFSHSAQGTQHVTGFRGTVNSEYFSSQLGLGKKKAVWACHRAANVFKLSACVTQFSIIWDSNTELCNASSPLFRVTAT